MTLKELFLEIFGGAERVAENAVHTIEKVLDMSLPQEITDVIARIKSLISGASDRTAADAKTISDLKDANSALQGQVNDLTSQLSDATSQLADIEAQLLAMSQAA